MRPITRYFIHPYLKLCQTDVLSLPLRNEPCLSQVKILQATGLPRHLSNFVFCHYHFWGLEEPVFTAPEVGSSGLSSASKDPQCTVVFDSTKVMNDAEN